MDMKTHTKKRTGPVIIICAGALLLVNVLFLYLAFPAIKRAMITSKTRLVNGTETWDKWADIRATVLLKFYVFNVTNPDAVVLNGSKFAMQELGPYVWEENRTKEVLSVDKKEDTVTYKEFVWYHFRQDLSNGSLEDKINMLNMPLYIVASLGFKNFPHDLTNEIIDGLMNDKNETKVSREVNIRELLFDGIKLKSAYGDLSNYLDSLPPEFYNGTFAFYNRKNGTPSVEWKIYRGVEDHANFGKILTYDREKDVPWWTNASQSSPDGQYCNRINGTDISIFPPFVKKDTRLFAFIPEICRSVYFDFEKEVDFHGIPAYQFVLPDSLLDDPVDCPENACFFTYVGDGMENQWDIGNFRVSACKAGAPIVFSRPHFLGSLDKIKHGVLGMKPERKFHKMDLIIEPESGAVLRLAKRLQINIDYQGLPGISAFEHEAHTHVPSCWVEESALQDEETFKDIRFRLVTIPKIVRYTVWSLVGILVPAIFVGIRLTVIDARQKQDSQSQPSINLPDIAFR